MRVRDKFAPRANTKVALAVKLFVSRRSTLALAMALREVCRFGSAVKMEGRIEGKAVGELPPSIDWKICVAAWP